MPSNYRSVPAARPIQAKDGTQGLHDHTMSDRLTGIVTIRIRAIDSFRIGSGGYSPFKSTLCAEVMTRKNAEGKDEIFIPGSSIKGALRSLAEALGGGTDPDDNGMTSVTCSLFGEIKRGKEARHLMGRVGISDALAYTDANTEKPKFGMLNMPPAFSPRKNVGRRFYDIPLEKPKGIVPHFVAVQGCVFEANIQLTNVRKGELGLLLTAAGMANNPADKFFPRLGGGKYYGLGRVEFSVVSARLRTGYVQPRPQKLEGAELAEAVKLWLNSAELAPDSAQTLAVLRS